MRKKIIAYKAPLYSLCQKKHTFNSKFFCGPHREVGGQIESGLPTICEFLAPVPQGGHKKIGIKCAFLLKKTVCTDWCT